MVVFPLSHFLPLPSCLPHPLQRQVQTQALWESPPSRLLGASDSKHLVPLRGKLADPMGGVRWGGQGDPECPQVRLLHVTMRALGCLHGAYQTASLPHNL